MTEVPATIFVAIGGAGGAMARYLVGQWFPGRRSTMIVNVLGSILLGAVTAAVVTDTLTGPPGVTARSLSVFVGTGFCGAFTTYSSVAVETQSLVADGKARTAVIFGIGMLTAALCGALAGRWLFL